MLMSITIKAQDIIEKKHSIGMSLTSLLNSTFKVDYEYQLNKNRSIVASVGYITRMDQDFNINGVSGEFQYRFYSVQKFMGYKTNLYVAPFTGIQYVDYKTNDYLKNPSIISINYESQYSSSDNSLKKEFTTIQGGFLFGIRSMPTDRIFVDANIGGGIKYCLDYDGVNFANLGSQTLGYSGIYTRTNITVGVAF